MASMPKEQKIHHWKIAPANHQMRDRDAVQAHRRPKKAEKRRTWTRNKNPVALRLERRQEKGRSRGSVVRMRGKKSGKKWGQKNRWGLGRRIASLDGRKVGGVRETTSTRPGEP